MIVWLGAFSFSSFATIGMTSDDLHSVISHLFLALVLTIMTV